MDGIDNRYGETKEVKKMNLNLKNVTKIIKE